MKRILAIILVLLGIAGLVLGRLGQTVWAPPTERTATVAFENSGPAVVIDPGVLYIGGETGKVTIEAPADVSVITAANEDIDAYLEQTRYTQVTGLKDWETIAAQEVNPDGEATIANPTQSDLWRTVETNPSPATIDIAKFHADETGDNEQPYRKILITTDGEQAAATSLTITWPVEARNAWVPFAYAAGALLLLLGLVLLIWSLLSSGRRKKREPAPVPVAPHEPEHAERLESASRSQGGHGRRRAVPVPVAPPEHHVNPEQQDGPQQEERPFDLDLEDEQEQEFAARDDLDFGGWQPEAQTEHLNYDGDHFSDQLGPHDHVPVGSFAASALEDDDLVYDAEATTELGAFNDAGPEAGPLSSNADDYAITGGPGYASPITSASDDEHYPNFYDEYDYAPASANPGLASSQSADDGDMDYREDYVYRTYGESDRDAGHGAAGPGSFYTDQYVGYGADFDDDPTRVRPASFHEDEPTTMMDPLTDDDDFANQSDRYGADQDAETPRFWVNQQSGGPRNDSWEENR